MTEQFSEQELTAIRDVLSGLTGMTPLGQIAVKLIVDKANLMIASFHVEQKEAIETPPGTGTA